MSDFTGHESLSAYISQTERNILTLPEWVAAETLPCHPGQDHARTGLTRRDARQRNARQRNASRRDATPEAGPKPVVGQDGGVLHLRICVPAHEAPAVLDLLAGDPVVSGLVHVPGAALRPPGDLILADVPREAGNELIDGLREIGVHQEGSIHVEPVHNWISKAEFEAEEAVPGSSADSVVWAEVSQRAYEDSDFNWTYATFMTLATLIAGIGVVIGSPILTIGAMVLGPEFGPIAALGLALVRRRRVLFFLAVRTLMLGFLVAVLVTTLATLLGRALGWVSYADVTRPHPGTAFIYTPDHWSFVVAAIAAAAGVLSLTSDRLGGLSGVFISVNTVPAAGNIGVGLAVGAADEVIGSTLQLLINIAGMALAGWFTLALLQAVWSRVETRPRSRRALRPPAP